MTTSRVAFDAGPLTPTQRRIGLTAVGGYFVDGYDLLVLSGALIAIVAEFKLTPGQTGLLTATAFAAMALGSLVSGPLTDRFGRRPVFFATMITFVVASLACLGVGALWQLIVVRFVVGLAIGGDMPPSAALITEFVPQRRRGAYTALGGVAWIFGGVVAISVTLLIYVVAGGTEPWRWALASGAIPAVVLLFFRRATPESPHWLAANGRPDEALEAWQYGRDGSDDAAPVADPLAPHDETATPGSGTPGFRTLLGRPFGLLLVVVAVYWFLNNLYGSAIVLYQPTLITRLVHPGPFVALLFTALFLLLAVIFGIVACFVLVDRFGRRPLALVCTGLVAVGGVLVYLGNGSTAVPLVGFALMIIVLNGGASLVFYSWAPELFPTRIRGRAVGVINMVGKSASVLSTLTLPTLYQRVGIAFFLLIAAAAVVNVVVVFLLAPETKGRSLAELEAGESALDQRRARRASV